MRLKRGRDRRQPGRLRSREASRRLVRRPAYSAAIVGMLALSIGANTAIFSLVDAIFLRPLPYDEPAELVAVWPGTVFSKADFVHFQEGMETVTRLAALWWTDVTWQGRGTQPERVTGARVSHDYFVLLGVEPLLGRAFTQAETEPGSALVVLRGRGSGSFGHHV